MIVRTDSPRMVAIAALVVLMCGGLASCGGGGSGPVMGEPPPAGEQVTGGGEDQMTITPRPPSQGDPPDLVVEVSSVSDSEPAAGARFTLSATVSNAGDGESPSTTLRYYRSTDATITTSDTEVGAEAVEGFGASGSSRGTVTLTAPSSPGTYYYGACVDAVTEESDTGNNCSSSVEVAVREPPPASLSGPDLLVEAPTVSASTLKAGEPVTLEVAVHNRGQDPSASTTLRYYRSTDATITPSDIEVGAEAVEGFGASGSSRGTVTLTAPSSPGTYYYGTCVDAVTEETDTGNNCSSAVQVTVRETPPPSQGHPDLVVESPSVSDSTPNPGEYFDFYATIRNRGDAASAATTFRYYMVRGHEDTISYENTKHLLVYPSVQGLEPGESVRVRTGATAVASPSVYNHYGGCVDAVAGETDTGNNCSALLKVTTEPTEPGQPVPLPDLVVESPSVSNSTPFREETFTFTVTVRNQGPGKSGFANVRFLYSDDILIYPPDDTVVKSFNTSSYAPAGSVGSSFTLSKPVIAPSSAGTYHYYSCVEMLPTQNLRESDTTNNCSGSVKVTVQAAPPGKPDLVVESPSVVGKTPNQYGHYFVKVGEAFSMQATVRNKGTGSSAATTLHIHFSAYPDLRKRSLSRGSAT